MHWLNKENQVLRVLGKDELAPTEFILMGYFSLSGYLLSSHRALVETVCLHRDVFQLLNFVTLLCLCNSFKNTRFNPGPFNSCYDKLFQIIK